MEPRQQDRQLELHRPCILAVSLNRENSNFKAHENPYQTLQSNPAYRSVPSNRFDANLLHRRLVLNQTPQLGGWWRASHDSRWGPTGWNCSHSFLTDGLRLGSRLSL